MMNKQVDVRVLLLEVGKFISVLDQDDAHYAKVALLTSATKTVH